MEENTRYRVRRALALSGLIGLCLAVIPAADAEGAEGCKVVASYTEKLINMAMGDVPIPANLPVGSVIASRQFDVPVNGASEMAMFCKTHGSIRGLMLQGVPVPGFSDVYSTNVEGVGVRLSRRISSSGGTNQYTVYYPHRLQYPPGTAVYLHHPAWFGVELIKTAEHTGSGPLAAGTYTRYVVDGDGKSVLTTFLTGTGTTIVQPSCEADPASRNILVQLHTLPLSELKAVGTALSDRPFEIRLNCKAGKHVAKLVYLRLDGQSDPSGAAGVLRPTPGEGSATGVGIQVLDSRSMPVAFGKDAQVGPSKNGVYVVSYTARYYQTAATVRPGVVKATATFTVDHK